MERLGWRRKFSKRKKLPGLKALKKRECKNHSQNKSLVGKRCSVITFRRYKTSTKTFVWCEQEMLVIRSLVLCARVQPDKICATLKTNMQQTNDSLLLKIKNGFLVYANAKNRIHFSYSQFNLHSTMNCRRQFSSYISLYHALIEFDIRLIIPECVHIFL